MSDVNGYCAGLDPDPSWCSGIILRPRMGEMRIPNIALQCVVYIGKATSKGTFNPIGPGFIGVIVRSRDYPTFYLVTADHVRRGLMDDRDFAIRINDENGIAQILRSEKAFRWWRHPTDESVDAAIYPWTFRDFPFAAFPFGRFVLPIHHEHRRESDPGIGIGDEIYITGLFRKLAGQARITPIVRYGHLAMMPTERIATPNYGEGLYYLVEAFSTAGLSGSPVFVNETVFFEYRGSPPRAYPENQNAIFVASATGPTHCLGLVHGLLPIEVMVELAGKAPPDQKWNSGISMVVPAEKILEIINQPKLIEYEDVVDKALKENVAVETALAESMKDEPTTRKRRNRDVEVPPISRDEFFGALERSSVRKREKK
jgi:hypothetical protein